MRTLQPSLCAGRPWWSAPRAVEAMESRPDPDHSADRELVRAVLAEDAAAIELLVARMRCIPRILSVLNQRVGIAFEPEDLGDVSQDTLVTFWSRIGAYTGQASLESWAYGFCLNGFMSALRRRRRAGFDPIDDAALPEGRTSADGLEYEELHRGLERLDEKEGRVIRLKYFEDLTFEEIGARLGISPNTAKTCYYRGMKNLAAFLAAPPAQEQP